MAIKIPLFDTPAQLELLRPEIEERLLGVVRSGQFILGPEVEAFEREFADYLGVGNVIGVANGTDALTISLRALGIGPGDDVVVPSFTFFATAEAVVHVGARPVFCDIDPETFCVTAETVEQALTAATRAVVPVHLFGTPAPMRELSELASERGIDLVEDAAQAAGARLDGARAGTLGRAATFSFFPSKNLFCLGDGGAIATNDDKFAERVDLLRKRGSLDGKKTFIEVGYNSRLDAIQAAVLRCVLQRLDEWNAHRRGLAGAYEEAGLGEVVSLPSAPAGAEPVYHLYVVRSQRRDELVAALEREGIQARPPYHLPLHRQEALREYAESLELPGTEKALETHLALPMGPTRGPDTAQAVADALRAVHARA
jgi:dTDP-3-amino-3,4,6-trideoxy-alpha-D-glucose transaminase